MVAVRPVSVCESSEVSSNVIVQSKGTPDIPQLNRLTERVFLKLRTKWQEFR